MTFAHGLASPSSWWGAWSWDPVVVASLAAVAVIYALGTSRLPNKARRARRACFFYAAWALLVIALVSPVDALGEALFSAHMVQHLLLMLGAAPLLVLGAPGLHLTAGLPSTERRLAHRLRKLRALAWLRRRARDPVSVWTVQAVIVWAWHLPVLYDAALDNDAVHALEHAGFLLVGLLFWSCVRWGARGRSMGYGAAILLTFTTALQSSALGAILTFATSPLYSAHMQTAREWGLTALTDQQLAGAIMWVPAGMIYVAAIALLFLGWLNSFDAATRRDDPVATVAARGER